MHVITTPLLACDQSVWLIPIQCKLTGQLAHSSTHRYYTCIAVPSDLPVPAHLVEDARVERWTRVKKVAMDSIIEFGGKQPP